MKCYLCGSTKDIIKTNNPLTQDICDSCLAKKININDLKQFAFFCRTYNLYWSPSIYIRAAAAPNLALSYMEMISASEAKDKIINPTSIAFFKEPVDDIWEFISKEWEMIKNHTQIKAKIVTIRDGFMDRCRLKWGGDFNFEEFMSLEMMYSQSVKSYGITDPMKLDALKKSCKISQLVDRAIDIGDGKAIKELISSLESTNKIAGITELANTTSEGRILTVSDLYAFLEKNGYQFQFYDKTPRDMVDFAINDIKESIRNEIQNATGVGLESILEDAKKIFEIKQDEIIDTETVEAISLKEVEDYYDELEQSIDNELASDSIDDMIDEELDY